LVADPVTGATVTVRAAAVEPVREMTNDPFAPPSAAFVAVMVTSGTLVAVQFCPVAPAVVSVRGFVNPAVKVKVIWVDTWYDPGKERQAAETLIAQGADVLCQNTDSPAVVQTAEKKGFREIAELLKKHGGK